LDFNPSAKAIAILDKVFIIVGVAAVIYGIVLTLVIGGRA
jgi:hypothetical protein